MKLIKFFMCSAAATILLTGCGHSESELQARIDDAYINGYYDALDCVGREGGRASNAVSDCE